MASHTRYPGMKTPHGVYGAQYQHPPHLMQNPTGVANVIPASVMGPPSMTATSIYGVQPGHQGMVAPNQTVGVYGRQVAPSPAAISAMQKQMKQKELEHQQQQEKMKKEHLFQEQKQRLKTMTGPNKGKQLSVDALMDSYLKPSALKPNPPPSSTSWYSSSGESAVGAAANWQSNDSANQLGPSATAPSLVADFQAWQDRDVPENYVQIYRSTLNAGGLIDTSILYPILMTSGLPRELLGHVWSLANQKIPGQLTKSELFLALAMIGFVQSGNDPTELAVFCQAPKPFPAILSIPNATSAPPGVSSLTQQQLQQSVSVPYANPAVSLSASVASLPASSLNFGVGLSASSSSTSSNASSNHAIVAQHSSLGLNSTPINPQHPAYPSQQSQLSHQFEPSFGPQSLPSAFSADHSVPVSQHSQSFPIQQQQALQQPPSAAPVNPRNGFPPATWEASSTTSVLPPSSSAASINYPKPNEGFSVSNTELRPISSSGSVGLGSVPSSSGPISTSSSAASLSFPPVFPTNPCQLPQTQSQGFTGAAVSVFSSTSVATPAVSKPAVSLSYAPPLLPTPLNAANPGDKYAAFKDLRAPEEEEDDFADFVEAEIKESEVCLPPATPPVAAAAAGVFAPPQPTPIFPVKSVSATEKIIENLNSFSISSKSRKSSSNDEFAAFASAENGPIAETGDAQPVADETWADFSQCFDDPVAQSQQQMQQQLQQIQRHSLIARLPSEPQTSLPSSGEDFSDFASVRSATETRVGSGLVRPQPAAAAVAPPPISDGYHFSDPFFSPDNNVDGMNGGGFANFNSKESTPSMSEGSGGKAPSSIATATPSYLDAVLTNGGVSRGSSIAAETQSVSSLELPAATCATSQSDSDSLNGQSTENNSITSDDPGSGGVNGHVGGSSQSQLNGLGEDYVGGVGAPRKISAVGMSSKQPLFGDRYSAVIEDVSASECLPRKWVECLQSCHRMIAAANANLSNLTSAAACLEFITAKKGLEYLTGIVEIYRVACRIFTSMKALGIVNKELGETMRDIEMVWQNLTTFLAKSPSIMPEPGALDFSNCVIRKPGTHLDAPVEKLCGVCLLNVEGRSKAVNPVTGDAFKLAYGGRQYHASCANLWVNCVNPILPALNLPSPYL